jgi:hypothetical protein
MTVSRIAVDSPQRVSAGIAGKNPQRLIGG